MELELSLICQRCNQILMRQSVTCAMGNTVAINVDELEAFAGACCNRPNRKARAEIKESNVIVDAHPLSSIYEEGKE